MTRHIFVFVLSIVLLTACANGESSTGDASADGGGTPQTGASQGGGGGQAPPASGDFAPITTHSGGSPGGDGTEIGIPGATFELPAGWLREAPSSSMRAAQAQIPGDGGAGQLTVFFFGVGGGGGTEGNIQRWIGQVEVATPAVRETFSGPGTKITWVEARGTIKPSTMGVGPTEPQPDSVLLGAVIEGAGGPWYFKATGPAATMDPQKDAFLAMLGTVSPASGG